MSSKFLFALLAAAASAKQYKFGVFTDIHLQPYYDPNLSSSQFCMPCTGSHCPDKKEEVPAYFGRMHCDSTFEMVVTAFDKMAADHPDLDFILMPGDMIGHEISQEFDTTDSLER